MKNRISVEVLYFSIILHGVITQKSAIKISISDLLINLLHSPVYVRLDS